MTPIETFRARIAFLIVRLDSLEHYLPETYQFLMGELDQQHKILETLEIQAFYQQQRNEQQNQSPDSTDQNQTQKPPEQATPLPNG